MSGDDELLKAASDDAGWENDARADGLEKKVLWQAAPGFASIALLRFAAGSGIEDEPRHASNQFLYCLSGSYGYHASGLMLEPGGFHWSPADDEQGPSTALEESVLLEIYDGRHYDQPEDEFEIPENRVGTALLHTNRLVNIWDVTLQPGESVPWHRHRFPYLVVSINSGQALIVDRETGSERRGIGTPGGVSYDPGGAHHSLKNVGESALIDRLIEFKVPTGPRFPPRVHVPGAEPQSRS